MSWDAACDDKITEGVEMCPFLRNIGVTTSFSFSNLKFPVPAPTRAGRGPIFEDGPGFETSFRLFHGKDGVVPLARATETPSSLPVKETSEAPNLSFHPLSASAAAISLSPFGPAGPFGFDGFMAKHNSKKPGKQQPKKEPQPEEKSKPEVNTNASHEAMGSEWLATGQCPIAKSFRAVSGVLPLVSKMMKLPSGMKYRCPPAIVAARAALAKTPAVKALRPQALPTKVLAIGLLGMALNVPLGVWREHTKKFSPQWFLAVHATIPFIAMLRKAVVMPKYAIAFTIGSAVLGQAVGARAEKIRLANLRAAAPLEADQLLMPKDAVPVAPMSHAFVDTSSPTINLTSTQHEPVSTLLENPNVEVLLKGEQKRLALSSEALCCGSELRFESSLSSVSPSPRSVGVN